MKPPSSWNRKTLKSKPTATCGTYPCFLQRSIRCCYAEPSDDRTPLYRISVTCLPFQIGNTHPNSCLEYGTAISFGDERFWSIYERKTKIKNHSHMCTNESACARADGLISVDSVRLLWPPLLRTNLDNSRSYLTWKIRMRSWMPFCEKRYRCCLGRETGS